MGATRVRLLSDVEAYYSRKFSEYGATARGVDWRDEASQRTRFDQLMRVADGLHGFSLLDYGCGYGALRDYIARDRLSKYTGFDLSERMLEYARLASGAADAVFTSDRSLLSPHDVVVASGIFNVRMDHGDAAWMEYVEQTLDDMNALSSKSMAFNMLTTYSDADKIRPDLHYADPRAVFDMCIKKYSRWVALLHDYGLYEFTILVRK